MKVLILIALAAVVLTESITLVPNYDVLSFNGRHLKGKKGKGANDDVIE